MAEAIAVAVLTFFAIEATAIAVAITTVIVGIGISVGTSLLAQAFLGSDAGTPGAPPSDRQFINRQPTSPRVRSYGRVRVAGAQAFLAAKDGTLYRVLAHNDGAIDGVEEHLIDETVVTLGADGWVTAPSNLANRIRVYWREGEAVPAHYDALASAFPEWDDTHRGKGVAHSLTLFKQVGQSDFFDVYPQGENTLYKQTLRASLIWDPRDPAQSSEDPATWLWSDNAALVVLDFLRHASGMGMPLMWIEPEIEAWKLAADACDEDVPLKNNGGSVKRYRLWGTYGYDERPADVLKRMMTGCNGRLWIGPNGGLAISVGVWSAPTVTLGGDAIESYRLGSGNEAPDTANTLTAVYVEREQGFREVEAQPLADDALVASFGEQRSDAKLYMVPHHSQCRRLMKQALARLAPEWRGTLTVNLAGLAVLSERFVTIEIDELNLSFVAEVDDVQFRIEDKNVVTGAIIDVTSVSAADFAWDADTEEGSPSEVPPTIEGSSITPPTNFSVTIEPRNGASYAVAVATWDAPTVDTLKVRLEYRVQNAEWQVIESSEGALSIETPPLTDGAHYEFRARHVGLLNTSDWTASVMRDVVVDAVAPDAPTALSTSKSVVDVTVAWTNPNSPNTFGARVYRHTTNSSAAATLVATRYAGANAAQSFEDEALADDDYFWWVAAINGSGVESARAPAGQETIP